MNGFGFAPVVWRSIQGNRGNLRARGVVPGLAFWGTVALVGERNWDSRSPGRTGFGETRNQGGELREREINRPQRGIADIASGGGNRDKEPESPNSRSVSWHFKHWVLNKRGWQADKAMMVLDLGNRLDRPSIIDLISQARPDGWDD